MKYLYAYRNIAVPANIITIVCCHQVWINGSLTVIGMMIWLKLFTTALLITYIHLFRSNLAFFFMNLGFGRIKFYSTMLIIDMGLFLVMTTIVTYL